MTEPRADRDPTVVDPSTFLLIKLLSGSRYVAHLCDRRPMRRDEIGDCAIGVGVVTAQGGKFSITRDGVINWIVYIVEGQMIVSKPSLAGQIAKAGAKANLGPVTSSAHS